MWILSQREPLSRCTTDALKFSRSTCVSPLTSGERSLEAQHPLLKWIWTTICRMWPTREWIRNEIEHLKDPERCVCVLFFLLFLALLFYRAHLLGNNAGGDEIQITLSSGGDAASSVIWRIEKGFFLLVRIELNRETKNKNREFGMV